MSFIKSNNYLPTILAKGNIKNIILLCILEIIISSINNYSQNWNKLNLPKQGDVKDIDVSYSNPNVIYLVGNYGTYKTVDSGETWIKVSNSIGSKVRVSYLDPNFVITDNEKSTNGGQSWIPIDLSYTDFEFSPSSNLTLYSIYDGSGELRKSTDFGIT